MKYLKTFNEKVVSPSSKDELVKSLSAMSNFELEDLKKMSVDELTELWSGLSEMV